MQQQINTQNQSNAKGIEAKLLNQIEASIPIEYECRENAYMLVLQSIKGGSVNA